jgi:hypothetical protein
VDALVAWHEAERLKADETGRTGSA